MYRTIIVPLDGSPLSERALPIATNLADATGALLVILRAVVAPDPLVPDWLDGPLPTPGEVETYLTGIREQVRHREVRVETIRPQVPADIAILDEIRLRDA